jgi:hypothetical protein
MMSDAYNDAKALIEQVGDDGFRTAAWEGIR